MLRDVALAVSGLGEGFSQEEVLELDSILSRPIQCPPILTPPFPALAGTRVTGSSASFSLPCHSAPPNRQPLPFKRLCSKRKSALGMHPEIPTPFPFTAQTQESKGSLLQREGGAWLGREELKHPIEGGVPRASFPEGLRRMVDPSQAGSHGAFTGGCWKGFSRGAETARGTWRGRGRDPGFA